MAVNSTNNLQVKFGLKVNPDPPRAGIPVNVEVSGTASASSPMGLEVFVDGNSIFSSSTNDPNKTKTGGNVVVPLTAAGKTMIIEYYDSNHSGSSIPPPYHKTVAP